MYINFLIICCYSSTRCYLQCQRSTKKRRGRKRRKVKKRRRRRSTRRNRKRSRREEEEEGGRRVQEHRIRNEGRRRRCVWVQHRGVGFPMKQWYHFVYIIVGGVHRSHSLALACVGVRTCGREHVEVLRSPRAMQEIANVCYAHRLQQRVACPR